MGVREEEREAHICTLTRGASEGSLATSGSQVAVQQRDYLPGSELHPLHSPNQLHFLLSF